MEEQNTTVPKKSKVRTYVLIVIVLAAIVLAVLWWLNYNKYVTTDDANLDSYRIDIASQVSGRISQLLVHEGDTVFEGQSLFEIESSAMLSRKMEAEAQYEQCVAEVAVAKITLSEAKKSYEVAVLAEGLSQKNYNRAKTQFEGDAIPLESLQTYEESWQSAVLQVQIAENRIQSAQANIEAAIKSAESAQANVETMSTDLSYYTIKAPASGIIGKRWSLAGDMISAGQTIFTLNKGTDIWVAIYLEETKFSHIYINQQAKFTLDAYDKLTFYGKIYYIGDNAASEFALVPPNNASGNYTKVTQRIPLKVSIDSVSGDEHQKDHYKLVSGMSATVKIIKDK